MLSSLQSKFAERYVALCLQDLDSEHIRSGIVGLSRLINQVVDLDGERGDGVSHACWLLRISAAVRAGGVFFGILYLGPAELTHWW